MKTLFLNPNSSDEITATIRRHVARGGWPAQCWAVAKVDGAPRIIGSAADNALAEAALAAALPTLGAGFERIVTMSSIDTGLAIAKRQFGAAAFGFTRSVLARHARLGQRLQIVTFDREMTAIYEAAFDATGHGEVVDGWSVIDCNPSTIAARPQVALPDLRERCERMGRGRPIFVVGAVGLELAASLRAKGMTQVIDPVADLLAWIAAE